jgi:hypothetical protein
VHTLVSLRSDGSISLRKTEQGSLFSELELDRRDLVVAVREEQVRSELDGVRTSASSSASASHNTVLGMALSEPQRTYHDRPLDTSSCQNRGTRHRTHDPWHTWKARGGRFLFDS